MARASEPHQYESVSAKSHHPIGKLVESDPVVAAAHISAALERHGGAIRETALELEVNGATLRRWIAKLDGYRVGPVRAKGRPAKPKKPAKKTHRKKDVAKRA